MDDMWAILLGNEVLAQYHDATGEPRVLAVVMKSLRPLAAGLDRTPLCDWGKFRWFEGRVPIFYAHERTREPWLLDLARQLRAQGWTTRRCSVSRDLKVPTPRRGLWKWTKHVVNTGMAPKAAALSWRLDRRESDHSELPHGDFEVKPTTRWNSGLIASGDSVAGLSFEERPIGDRPFPPGGAGTWWRPSTRGGYRTGRSSGAGPASCRRQTPRGRIPRARRPRSPRRR